MKNISKVFIKKLTDNLENDIHDSINFLINGNTISKDTKIFFKPNLTYPIPKMGVTTRTIFIDNILRVFSNYSSHLFIGESNGGYRGWPAELAFKNHDLYNVCHRYNAKLVNLSTEPSVKVNFRLSSSEVDLNLPSLLLNDIDLFITLPVPKIHQVTLLSGAVKNQWGCIPDNMRLLYHPFFNELIIELNKVLKTKIAIADGYYFLDCNGPIEGIPIEKKLIIASDNIYVLDKILCEVMGIDEKEIRYLAIAQKKGLMNKKEDVLFNDKPISFFENKFLLNLTLRNRIVKWSFDRKWAVNLIWNSWFGDFLHSILYLLKGNPIQKLVKSSKKMLKT